MALQRAGTASRHRPRINPVGLPWRELWLCLGLPLLAAGLTAAPAVEPERDLSGGVTLGFSEGFFPYSFPDGAGGFEGFGIELTEAVAREARLKITQRPLADTRFETALRNAEIDALQLWAETPARRAWADFSVPVVRFKMVVLVRKDETRIRRHADLRGMNVAVGQHGSIGERFLRNEHPAAIPRYTEHSEELLRGLATGAFDAAVMSDHTALSKIEKLGLANLTLLKDKPTPADYDVRYCFAVRKGDALLLARLNEGLAHIRATGEFDRIYARWFGRFDRVTLSSREAMLYVALALVLIGGAVLWGVLRQRALRRRVESQAAELTEQRSLLSAVHERHPLATLVLEIAPGRPVSVVSLNQEALQLFAVSHGYTAGGPLASLGVAPELRPLLDDAITRWHKAGRAAQWEAPVPSRQQVLEIGIVPLGPRGKGAQGLCVLAADISKRRRMDEELAKSRRLRALGELVGGIAHEFNNLLTPIIATTSMLQEDKAKAGEVCHRIGMIEEAASRAADLTRRLLTFGRKTDEPVTPVCLVEVVLNCEALLKTMIDRRIEWKNSLPETLPPIVFNPTDLSQIVFNLVLNARDTLMEKSARPPDRQWRPRIGITAAELPATAHALRHAGDEPRLAAWQRLSVTDNGMGIAPDIIERIYEPFFTTKEVGRGTGLGLSTLWHQVIDAGGDVAVESKVGEGTTFHVYLPRWLDDADGVPAQAEAAEVHAEADPGGRILVVDDEVMVARTTGYLLERRGFAVEVITDSAAALARLKAPDAGFDLLLVDLSMPGMGGLELVRQVRAWGCKARVVIMSGRVGKEDEQVMQQLGIDCVLEKPFTTGRLMATLAELLPARVV